MNVNKTCNVMNLEVKNNEALISIEVILYVTYHLKWSFVILR
jgi:hypothetical protein